MEQTQARLILRISYKENCRKEVVLLLLCYCGCQSGSRVIAHLEMQEASSSSAGMLGSLSVVMLTESHLVRPNREARRHISLQVLEPMGPQTNSFIHFSLRLIWCTYEFRIIFSNMHRKFSKNIWCTKSTNFQMESCVGHIPWLYIKWN